MRVAYNVDRTTHKYIVDKLTENMTSIKTDVFCRYIKFLKSLCSSPSHEVRAIYQMMIHDRRSNTGNNLHIIERTLGKNPFKMSYSNLRASLHDANSFKVPEQDLISMEVIMELLEARRQPQSKEEFKEIEDNLFLLGCT